MTTVASAEVKISASGEGQVTNQLGKLAGALKGVAKLAVAGAVSKYTRELIKMGVASTRAEKALDALSGGNADEYIEAVGEATAGTMSQMDAMQVSAKFLSMGLANTSTEAAEMARVAATLGGVFQGLNAGQAADQFALLLSNMSVQRLDTFGISSAQVRTRIAELQAAVPGLTREMAFLQATMEIATSTADQFGDIMNDAGGAAARIEADMQDMGAAAGQALAEIAEPAINLVSDITTGAAQATQDLRGIGEVWRDMRRDIIANTGSYQEFRLEQARVLRNIDYTDQAVIALTGNLHMNERMYNEIVADLRAQEGAAKKAAQANEDLGYSYAEITQQMAAVREQAAALARQEVSIAIDFGLGGMPGMEDMFGAIAESPEAFGLATGELLEMGRALGIVTPEAEAAASAWQFMTNELASFDLTGQQTAELLQDMKNGADGVALGLKAMEMSAQNAKDAVEDMADDAADRIAELMEESPAEIEVEANTEAAEWGISKLKGSLATMPQRVYTEVIAKTDKALGAAMKIKSLLDSIAGTYSAQVNVSGGGFGGGGGGAGGATSIPYIPQIAVGGLAEGGPVTPGHPYVVGEEGPELFVPSVGGQIIPNGGGGGGMGGGTQSVTITVPVILDGREVGRGAISGTLDALQTAGVIEGGMVAA